jgi:hypothetical protein
MYDHFKSDRYTNKFDYRASRQSPGARAAYDAREKEIMETFTNDLFEDLGITDNPKRYKLYSIAWEMGHSSGFQEVYNYALQLVDLIKD